MAPTHIPHTQRNFLFSPVSQAGQSVSDGMQIAVYTIKQNVDTQSTVGRRLVGMTQ